MTGGMAEMDARFDDGGRLARRALSEETRRALHLDRDPAAPGPSPDRPDDHRPRRTLRSDLRRLVGTSARRGRLAVLVTLLTVAVAGPLLARASVSDARAEVRAQGAERAGAADARAATETREAEATAEEAVAVDLAAQALAAHDEQRQRLAALGLNEATIDAFLLEVTANAELVEFRRDRTTGDVNRRAGEIPQMQECVRVASRALNAAWNSATFGDAPPPAPSDLCMALLAAGT